jgi:hypothetical protein
MKRLGFGMAGLAAALAVVGGGIGGDFGSAGEARSLPASSEGTTIFTEVDTGGKRKRRSGSDRKRASAKANAWKPRDTFGKSVARNHRRGNR